VAHGITVRFGDRAVISGLDLDAGAGSLVAVTGPSGAGKTTLLMVLAGVLEPSEGSVKTTVDHRDGTASASRWRVGYVPQTLGLAPWLTASENIGIVLQASGVVGEAARRRTAEVLAAVGLETASDRIVTELSGGQRQRVAVARALAPAPQVLLADEPTAELDAENRQLVLRLLLGAAAEGAVVIVATHDPDVADACTSAYEIRDGRLAELPRPAPGAANAGMAERNGQATGSGSAEGLERPINAAGDGPSPEDDPAAGDDLFKRPGEAHKDEGFATEPGGAGGEDAIFMPPRAADGGGDEIFKRPGDAGGGKP
jgi:putative ABC transport system ATP-binding protein